MRFARRDLRPRGASALAAAFVGLLVLAASSDPRPAWAQTTADIQNTAHNLSTSGTGTIRALNETRICVFCHTPHNSTPMTPLWNRELQPRVYTVYTSPTLTASPLPQPTGPTKLCLGCHDGTVAMGTVMNPASGIAMAGSDVFGPGSLSNFGLDLSAHHPVSFSYQASLPNPALAPSPPESLVFGGADELHCTTCHDPHDDRFGRFLRKDNRYSALCVTCHDLPGWSTSAHATSPAPVAGVLPRPPKTWPNYATLAEWGCETCHTPHFAPTAPQLLNFTSLPPEPFSCTNSGCHSSDPAAPHALSSAGAGPGSVAPALPRPGSADIAAQMRKPSSHRETPGALEMRAAGASAGGPMRGVTCIDCHNPHVATSTESAPDEPGVGGALRGVAGTDRNGIALAAARNEFEVCLKCHGDDSADRDFVPRVLPDTNKRRAFDPNNASFHPVMAMGRSLDVPSLPSTLEPTMTATSRVKCTSCHADDDGASEGPHGSAFLPILRERYETADNTTESFENYALCYRCHDRQSILSDRSFRPSLSPTTSSGGGHRGHLAAGAPCSACHDPHGVSTWGGATDGSTGDHTHLVNFDRTIVSPRPGALVPVFRDRGSFTGSCDLMCHGFDHDGAAYP
jgi:predicted CXXCH cytochrome family protein